MDSEFIIGQGAGHKLELACRRHGEGNELLEWLSTGDNLKGVSQLARGDAELVIKTKPAPPAESTVKFDIFVDIGIITVPDNYDHATQLDRFMKENCEEFYSVNDNIKDKNFPNPSRVLKPGDKLRIRAFKQVVPGRTTSEERMAFLVTQKAVYTGAQGASLVFEQKRDQLPKGKWYASMDKKENLWEDADGVHRVPGVGRGSDGDFHWRLGFFEVGWYDYGVLLCSCDIEPDEVTGK